MILVVPTIRHTGSRFVVEHLLQGFIRRNPTEPPIGDTVYMAHIGEKSEKHLGQWINGRNIIVPLRRLEAIIVSWERRQLKLDDLRQRLRWLIAGYEGYEPYYLPLDHPKRDRYLDLINGGLGLNLKTDWPVVHSEKGSSAAQWDDVQKKVFAGELFDEFYPFFSRVWNEVD